METQASTPTLIQKIVSCFVRSRLYRLMLLSIASFFVLSFSLQIFEKTSKLELASCRDPEFQEWKEELVQGQVRTIRVKINKTKKAKGPPKTILLWTTYFGEAFSNDFYFFQEGRKTFDRYNCKVRNCYVTANKSMLPYTDAVLFHVPDLVSSNIPSRFRDDQIWILYSMEPPRYSILKWHGISSLFNWTMTYRSDSDIQVKYGEFVHRNKSCGGNVYNTTMLSEIKDVELYGWLVIVELKAREKFT
ncbi:hypothetical protein TNCT_437831 [Trichonephila clavata]|uniref:Fucosyltransferase N-terminal domain-containing protein n=1 Tax=Trichonephila clavata TaxID=2740835 RepID=A0A8X6M1G9_TRICU|nr:hypothetical protein TNCT_437831 [Trichonephila clavata]